MSAKNIFKTKIKKKSNQNYEKVNEGDPVVIHGINTGFLQHGTWFDLNEWKVIKYGKL